MLIFNINVYRMRPIQEKEYDKNHNELIVRISPINQCAG